MDKWRANGKLSTEKAQLLLVSKLANKTKIKYKENPKRKNNCRFGTKVGDKLGRKGEIRFVAKQMVDSWLWLSCFVFNLKFK